MKKIDMHMHTTFSDGSLSFNEVINRARNNKCFLISITDHEFLNDYSYLNDVLSDVEIANGIELILMKKVSIYWDII